MNRPTYATRIKISEMAGFLGISIDRGTAGKVTLTQTGLIDRILSVIDMDTCSHKYTPAEKLPLGKDETGDPCREDWKYRSVVGILFYLAGISRPNIAYVVHQCARFSHNHKHAHEIGVKHGIRYLKGTRNK